MARQRIKYQQIILNVTTPRLAILREVETDRLYRRLTGINVIINGPVGCKFSKFYMDVDGVEVFPKDFEVLRLLFRDLVPFGFDYHQLEEKAEGSRIKFEYTDVPPVPLADPLPYPYTVIISLRLENDREPGQASSASTTAATNANAQNPNQCK